MGKPYIDEDGNEWYAVRAVQSFLLGRQIVRPDDCLALSRTQYLYYIKGGIVADDDYLERQAKAEAELLARLELQAAEALALESQRQAKAEKKAAAKLAKIEAESSKSEPVVEAPAPPPISDEEVRAQLAELSMGLGA
ncbi:hypothetical protein [Paludisphaera borealis]|nr:hypothetical protein [Paludisphaera borealis]